MPAVGVQVAPIVEAVRQQGDSAVAAYTRQFDRAEVGATCVPIQVITSPTRAFRYQLCSLQVPSFETSSMRLLH